MSLFFKVFHCRSPKKLFTDIRCFRVHEISPPGGLLLYWCEGGRNYFPFRPLPNTWYHRPKRGNQTSASFSLIAKCWSGTANTKMVVEVL